MSMYWLVCLGQCLSEVVLINVYINIGSKDSIIIIVISLHRQVPFCVNSGDKNLIVWFALQVTNGHC
jgi:hypothetical protein